MPNKIDSAVKERAVRLVREHRQDYLSLTATTAAARQERRKETAHRWALQAEIDAGEQSGSTNEADERIKGLKSKVRRLKEANAILKAAPVFFASMPS